MLCWLVDGLEGRAASSLLLTRRPCVVARFAMLKFRARHCEALHRELTGEMQYLIRLLRHLAHRIPRIYRVAEQIVDNEMA